MKLFHLADLHLGKRVNEFSMVEDQRHILTEVLALAEQEKPDVILLAGDIYDKPIPPVEAVDLLDWFLTELSCRKLPVLLISGNHDSADRLAFGSHLMKQSGVVVAKAFHGIPEPVTLEDEYGPVHFYLLPFFKPAMVRGVYGKDLEQEGREIRTYQEAADYLMERFSVPQTERNVLVAHQLVTAASLGANAPEPQRSDSEAISVGGVENIDFSTFSAFDYVALGHLHGPQQVGRPSVRYAGTLLKYSFSEVHHHKSVTIVELKEKGSVTIATKELHPLHDMAELKGSFDVVMQPDTYKGDKNDYLHVTLTDEQDIPDVMNSLRLRYPNLMKLDYDNTRTRNQQVVGSAERVQEKSPIDLFDELYEKQNGAPLEEDQRSFLNGLIEQIWREER